VEALIIVMIGVVAVVIVRLARGAPTSSPPAERHHWRSSTIASQKATSRYHERRAIITGREAKR
jgi:hypothetical protein